MVTPIRHQEILDEAEDKVEGMTGLRPTNEKLLRGITTLGIPPCLRDHIRCMLIGKIRCARFRPYLVVGRGTRVHSLAETRRSLGSEHHANRESSSGM